MGNAYKHAAANIMPDKETIAVLSHMKKPETAVLSHTETAVPSPKPEIAVLSRANALYTVGKFMVFKSPDMPGVVDVYEIVDKGKIRQLASFLRENDKYALGAAKKYLLTKV